MPHIVSLLDDGSEVILEIDGPPPSVGPEPVSRLHDQIGDPTLADAILERLVHHAHRIEMRGDRFSGATSPYLR